MGDMVDMPGTDMHTKMAVMVINLAGRLQVPCKAA